MCNKATANSNQVTYNGKNQTASGFTATGLVGGEDESVLTGISTTGGQGKNAGSYSHT
ncbi:MBG domain-containing protein, partial [Acinetobacter junii]|uniref:MBG domain-containing protein n=1 Tax=Acinetobacter junii TaxID=40215 RepID=UPI003AF42196